MLNKPYKYRVSLYAEDGQFYWIGHVFADFNLDGILRDDMFINKDGASGIAGIIEYVQRLN